MESWLLLYARGSLRYPPDCEQRRLPASQDWVV